VFMAQLKQARRRASRVMFNAALTTSDIDVDLPHRGTAEQARSGENRTCSPASARNVAEPTRRHGEMGLSGSRKRLKAPLRRVRFAWHRRAVANQSGFGRQMPAMTAG
jgi:hypothetical protein